VHQQFLGFQPLTAIHLQRVNAPTHVLVPEQADLTVVQERLNVAQEDGRLLQRAVLCYQTHKIFEGDLRVLWAVSLPGAGFHVLFSLSPGQLQGGGLSLVGRPAVVHGLGLLPRVSQGGSQAVFHVVITLPGGGGKRNDGESARGFPTEVQGTQTLDRVWVLNLCQPFACDHCMDNISFHFRSCSCLPEFWCVMQECSYGSAACDLSAVQLGVHTD